MSGAEAESTESTDGETTKGEAVTDDSRARLIEVAKRRGESRWGKSEETPEKPKAEPEKTPEAEAEDAETKEEKPDQKKKRDEHSRWAALTRREKKAARREGTIQQREAELRAASEHYAKLQRLADEDPVAFVEAAKISPAKFAQKWVERAKGQKTTPEDLEKQALQDELKTMRQEMERLKQGPPAPPTPPERDAVVAAVREDFEASLTEDGDTAYPNLHLDLEPEQVIEKATDKWFQHLKQTGKTLDADELFELLEEDAIKAKAGSGEKPDYAARRAKALKRAGKAVGEAAPEKTSGADEADGERTREKGEHSAESARTGQGAEKRNRPSVLTNQTSSTRGGSAVKSRGKDIRAAVALARRLKSKR